MTTDRPLAELIKPLEGGERIPAELQLLIGCHVAELASLPLQRRPDGFWAWRDARLVVTGHDAGKQRTIAQMVEDRVASPRELAAMLTASLLHMGHRAVPVQRKAVTVQRTDRFVVRVDVREDGFPLGVPGPIVLSTKSVPCPKCLHPRDEHGVVGLAGCSRLECLCGLNFCDHEDCPGDGPDGGVWVRAALARPEASDIPGETGLRTECSVCDGEHDFEAWASEQDQEPVHTIKCPRCGWEPRSGAEIGHLDPCPKCAVNGEAPARLVDSRRAGAGPKTDWP